MPFLGGTIRDEFICPRTKLLFVQQRDFFNIFQAPKTFHVQADLFKQLAVIGNMLASVFDDFLKLGILVVFKPLSAPVLAPLVKHKTTEHLRQLRCKTKAFHFILAWLLELIFCSIVIIRILNL
ncbi:MAG: hypothetical protein WCY21_01080 [Candidatus Cloacimonadaceae bacterium]